MIQPRQKKRLITKKLPVKTVIIVLAIFMINSLQLGIFHYENDNNKNEWKSNSNFFVSSAYRQSFGLFDDISESMWNSMISRTKKNSLYDDPANPLNGVENQPKWLADNMNPNFECPHVERIGGGEGVKYICYPQRIVREDKKDCLIYSIGCAGDFHFEDALAKYYDKQCEIHIFDPADWTRKNDAEEKNIHYHPWGLLSSYDTTSKSKVWPKGRGGGFKTFAESIAILGHQDRTIDIFKIDCEGCEWTTHKDWIGFGKLLFIT